MIEAVLIFNNYGDLVAKEILGVAELGDSMKRFLSALSEIIGGKKHSFRDHLNLGNRLVSYIADEEHSLITVSPILADVATLEEVLTKIWERCVREIDGVPINKVMAKAVNIVLSQEIKIAIFGQPRVGKTTISRMILKKRIPLRYVSTIGVKVRPVPGGLIGSGTGIVLWDIGGQPRFRSMWPTYLRGSQLVLVTTDSTLESVLWARKMIPHVRSWTGDAALLGVANKQDRPVALTCERVSSILGIDTIPLTALEMLDPSERSHLIDAILDKLGSPRNEPSSSPLVSST
ncbi:MAG: hypothetical protein GF309_14205 [Candidatus Lokiarchaeota archaeon]|nr:hypothetical protein [Candidatus Lokiarchaeota archaeon]